VKAKYTLEQASEETGLEPELIRTILTTLGLPATAAEQITDSDLELLRYGAAALLAGLPLVAYLQLVRVYGQALAQIADAEVRLFHMYVHEPLMRAGVPGVAMAEEMEGLVTEVLPLASPVMDHIHQRLLAHFVDQDVVGHMEAELDGRERLDLGHLRVAIAFADLAGYTRMTEELGDEHAVGVVERFVAEVEHTLPDDARIIKTIGDEVMVVSSDAGALVDWAVGFQELHDTRPLPRIGMHYGEVLYRDGDYYGREVNQAARVSARSGGGEVLVTRPVVEAAGPHLEFEHIGDVRLKGFTDPTELFLARVKE
jgi:adenylate cyclase